MTDPMRTARSAARESSYTARTRPLWLAWVGAVTGALLAVLFWMPAAWLTGQVGRATQQRVVLEDARGTVWTGSARLLLSGGEGSRDAAALPGRVDWRLRPRWNGVWLELQAGCCTRAPIEVTAQPRWGGANVQVGPVNTRWPLGLLGGLGTPWNTVQLQGELDLSSSGLQWTWVAGRLDTTGQLRMQAMDVTSRLSTLRPLGSYLLEYAAPGLGQSPRLTLSTLSGSLVLTGQGQWVGPRLRFNGEATAVEGREVALDNLLNIIGRRLGTRSVITVG